MPGSASTPVITPLASAHQRRVRRLVALGAELRLGLVELGLGRGERGVAALELGRADEALVAQLLEALEIGRGPARIGVGGDPAGTCRVLPELEVLRVELGQHLPGLHDAARIHVAARDLAADAEARGAIRCAHGPRRHTRAHPLRHRSRR
jgi:hypothetical protein